MSGGSRSAKTFPPVVPAHERCICSEPLMLKYLKNGVEKKSASLLKRGLRLLTKLVDLREDVKEKLLWRVEGAPLPVVTVSHVVKYIANSVQGLRIEYELDDRSGRVKILGVELDDLNLVLKQLIDLLSELFNCSYLYERIDKIGSYLQPLTCPTCRGKLRFKCVCSANDKSLLKCLNPSCGTYFLVKTSQLEMARRQADYLELVGCTKHS